MKKLMLWLVACALLSGGALLAQDTTGNAASPKPLPAGATNAAGQTAPSAVAFEVATVKPSPPLDMAKLAADIRAGKMPRLGPHVSASQAEYTYMPIKELIAIAYKVKAYQITGPPWLATERFDIVAKMPDGASKDDAPKMLAGVAGRTVQAGRPS